MPEQQHPQVATSPTPPEQPQVAPPTANPADGVYPAVPEQPTAAPQDQLHTAPGDPASLDAIDEAHIEDRRPAQWETTPYPARLVGTKMIDGHLTFTVLHQEAAGPRVCRWWMPYATEAMNHVDGRFMTELVESNPSSAETILALEAVKHSGIDDDTLDALMSLPARSTGEILGRLTSEADQNGTSAGESRGSAAN